MCRFSMWKRFLRDHRAGTAIVFAIASVPIFFLIAAGVDYCNAILAKERLRSAADAAALTAVSTANMSATPADAATLATSAFNTSAALIPSVSGATFNASISDSGNQRTTTVTYSANVQTLMSTIMGVNFLTLSGTVSASNTRTTYVAYYLVIDNTPSMGMGATQADINVLKGATPDNCGFSCHITGSSSDYYTLAKQLGITTRLDMARLFAQSLMDKLKETRRVSDQFKVSLIKFGSSTDKLVMNTPFAMSADLDAAKTAINNLAIMVAPYRGYRQDTATDFYTIFPFLSTMVPGTMDGQSALTPLRTLVFITDGLTDRREGSRTCSSTTRYFYSDSFNPLGTWRCFEAFNPTMCDQLKTMGLKIAVVYTPYIPLSNDPYYFTFVQPNLSNIPVYLKACASPGLYSELTPGSSMQSALQALLPQGSSSGSALLTR